MLSLSRSTRSSNQQPLRGRRVTDLPALTPPRPHALTPPPLWTSFFALAPLWHVASASSHLGRTEEVSALRVLLLGLCQVQLVIGRVHWCSVWFRGWANVNNHQSNGWRLGPSRVVVLRLLESMEVNHNRSTGGGKKVQLVYWGSCCLRHRRRRRRRERGRHWSPRAMWCM
jgi:hypothetical protein